VTTRVLVAHGGRVLAEALSAAVSQEPGLRPDWTVTDPAQALILVGRARPDAVLAHVPDGEWASVVLAIVEAYPQTRVVVLLSPAATQVGERLRAAGVHLVDAASEGVGAALDALRPSGRADEARRRTEPTRAAAPGSALAPADVELLRLVAAGLDSQAAARELGTGPGLVRRRLHRICVELGAETPMQAVAVALRDGLIRLGPGPSSAGGAEHPAPDVREGDRAEGPRVDRPEPVVPHDEHVTLRHVHGSEEHAVE
jgi:DNA-binding NarL/FixJ family response regulator